MASATLTTFPGFFNDRENPVNLILFINTQPEYHNIFEAAEPRTCSCERVSQIVLRMFVCKTGHGSDSSHPAVMMRCPALTHREGGRRLFKKQESAAAV